MLWIQNLVFLTHKNQDNTHIKRINLIIEFKRKSKVTKLNKNKSISSFHYLFNCTIGDGLKRF
jgi:hypothetical protein